MTLDSLDPILLMKISVTRLKNPIFHKTFLTNVAGRNSFFRSLHIKQIIFQQFDRATDSFYFNLFLCNHLVKVETSFLALEFCGSVAGTFSLLYSVLVAGVDLELLVSRLLVLARDLDVITLNDVVLLDFLLVCPRMDFSALVNSLSGGFLILQALLATSLRWPSFCPWG